MHTLFVLWQQRCRSRAVLTFVQVIFKRFVVVVVGGGGVRTGFFASVHNCWGNLWNEL